MLPYLSHRPLAAEKIGPEAREAKYHSIRWSPEKEGLRLPSLSDPPDFDGGGEVYAYDDGCVEHVQ